MNDLADAGLPIVRAVRLKGGRCSMTVTAAEGVRPILVFESAPPSLPGPLDLGQAKQLGALLARIHVAADGRSIDQDIPDSDLDAVDRAVSDVISAVQLSNRQGDILRIAAKQVIERYERLPRTPPSFGVIHGDLATSNIRLASDRTLWLFDFGAMRRTWRINELFNAKQRAVAESNASWDALRAGYSSLVPLPEHLEELEGTYRLFRKLVTMGYICNALTLRRGIEVIEEFDVVRQIEELRQMMND
jgi:Ser/Thr protein kinase RdoA (MazF antagonist)